MNRLGRLESHPPPYPAREGENLEALIDFFRAPRLCLECVPQSISQQVKGKERGGQRHAGEYHQPPVRFDRSDMYHPVGGQTAPTGCRRLYAQSEETQERLLQHHRWYG